MLCSAHKIYNICERDRLGLMAHCNLYLFLLYRSANHQQCFSYVYSAIEADPYFDKKPLELQSQDVFSSADIDSLFNKHPVIPDIGHTQGHAHPVTV